MKKFVLQALIICGGATIPFISGAQIAETSSTSTAPGMMPARLAEFTASINEDNEVNIRWTTTFEQSADRFEIERSSNGSNFEKVGQVKATGNTGAKMDYSYDDAKLQRSIINKKDVYYRLKLIDLNNRAETSKVLVVRLFKTKTTKMISVSPDQAANDINVQVQLKENSYVVMKITNSNGAEITRKSIHGNAGLNIFPLEGTNKLQTGIYTLEVIINSNERMSAKLIKS